MSVSSVGDDHGRIMVQNIHAHALLSNRHIDVGHRQIHVSRLKGAQCHSCIGSLQMKDNAWILAGKLNDYRRHKVRRHPFFMVTSSVAGSSSTDSNFLEGCSSVLVCRTIAGQRGCLRHSACCRVASHKKSNVWSPFQSRPAEVGLKSWPC